MVSSARGRLFKRKDGRYLLYLPTKLVEDSMFPFKVNPAAVYVRVSFKVGDNKVTIEALPGQSAM